MGDAFTFSADVLAPVVGLTLGWPQVVLPNLGGQGQSQDFHLRGASQRIMCAPLTGANDMPTTRGWRHIKKVKNISQKM